MWPPLFPPSPRHHTSPFSCSSFKDLPLLLSSDTTTTTTTDTTTPSPLHRLTAKTIFHRVRLASSLLRNWPHPNPNPKTLTNSHHRPLLLPAAQHRVILYHTSLRVVRRTFDACRSVLSILHAFPVSLDERDVSVFPAFLDELQEILRLPKHKLTLPKVFIGGRFVGGADEIYDLYETGELKKLLDALPPANSAVCTACAGYRFVLCGECSGSHKIFSGKGGFRCCTACSDDGLVKCPLCYPTPLVPP